MKRLALIAVLPLFGCGPTLKFTSAGATRPAKPPTCPIVVLDAAPTQPYEELGTLNIQYDNTGFLSKPEDLKRKIQPEVCKVGGDAAIGIANSYGTYTQAKVLSFQLSKPEPKAKVEDESSGAEQETGAVPGL